MKTSRKTQQKKLIKEEVEKQNGFFSANQIYEKVKEKNPQIGIATVYRFLKEGKKTGKLYTYTCNGKYVYSNNKKSHCHFFCSDSGKEFHFEIDDIDFIKDKIPVKNIESIQIEVKGKCQEEK